MELNEFVNRFENHPVIFLGAGFSIRYCKESVNWDELLRNTVELLLDSDEEYFNIKYRNNSDYAKTASEIQDLFNKQLEVSRNGKFKEINDIFFESMRKGIALDRFKIFIASKFSKYEINEDKRGEIEKLKNAAKNIATIITTNYDSVAEDIFKYKVLVGNDILLSNPYGSIYKIHGSYKKPSSIILTQKDYNLFEEQYELIKAQLISIFIQNPIIFIGYNVGDSNIRKLLETIFKYVDPNSDIAHRITDNFLIVEYKKDEQNTNVEDFVIQNNSRQIRVNKVSTDNFSALYDSLASLHLKISAMDVRKVQNILSVIVAGKCETKVEVEYSVSDLQNTDKVLLIGAKKQYTNLKDRDFRVNYFKHIDERDPEIVKLIDNVNVASTQYFPIFGYLTINEHINTGESRKQQQIHKIQEIRSSINALGDKIRSNSSTINDILIDDSIRTTYKPHAIMKGVLEDRIPLTELKSYLQQSKPEDIKDYNKLLVVYDYKKYYCNNDR